MLGSLAGGRSEEEGSAIKGVVSDMHHWMTLWMPSSCTASCW